MIKGVLFDLEGVLIASWKPLPYAIETVQEVQKRDLNYGFLTNTTSQSRTRIASQLQSLGFDCRVEQLFTASYLTAQYINENFPDAFCWIINEGDLGDDFAGIDYVTQMPNITPDLIVLGGAGEKYSHKILSKVYEYLLQGVPIVAMHKSYFWAAEDGLRIDIGVYLEGLQIAAGKKIPIIAKPTISSFAFAADQLHCDPHEVVIVGDDMKGDVFAGQASGMTGVLVRTGKFRQDILEDAWHDEFGQVPDYVIAHIGELITVLAKLLQ